MDNKTQAQLMDDFKQVAQSLDNSYVQDWKKNGGKVMGYFCSMIPEELFIAAGFLPFRMRGTGSVSTNLADSYFRPTSNCSFPRHCFDLALNGKYEFLDGVTVGTTCDTMRFVVDNWKHAALKPEFISLLNIPHVSGEVMAEYYAGSLESFRQVLEEQYKVSITPEKLTAAIKLCNETRSLQRQLSELRISDTPVISGSDFARIMVAGVSMPKDLYNAALQQLLQQLPKAPAAARKKTLRLMLIGSGGDDTLIQGTIEELGAEVVCDFTCFGGKLPVFDVDEQLPPLEALAQYHILQRPFCAKMCNAHQKRLATIMEYIKKYKVDGVIGQRFGCCDCWAAELHMLRDDLQDIGVPFLILEREYVPDDNGQIETRVQAFIETVEGVV